MVTYVMTTGTMIITRRMIIPTAMHMRIFMSFHHIFLRTWLAPRRKPWAEIAKLSGATRSALFLSEIMYSPDVQSITQGERTSLVLKTVESGAAVRDLVDVLAHDTDGIIDLLYREQFCQQSKK